MLVPSIIGQDKKAKRKAHTFSTLKIQRAAEYFDALSCKDYEPEYSGRVIKIKVVEVVYDDVDNKRT